MNSNVPPKLIERLEELVDASFSGRDELYAAAKTLDDHRRSNVCKQLADHLASHAIELQQLLSVNGKEPPQPLNMFSIAEVFFQLAMNRNGESEVLRFAERCERTVKERFEAVIDIAPKGDTSAILQRQRDDIEFGEQVLQSMQDPPKTQSPNE
ncbi:MAG: hypothetical protein KDA87_12075 [Planctomycetales bacterium]|nr:hypothetical protein [Planctomycetales bacterium]